MTQAQQARRVYSDANRERIRANNAAWAKANPEKVKAYKRAYTLRHAAELARKRHLQRRLKKEADPEAQRAEWRRLARNYRAKKKGL